MANEPLTDVVHHLRRLAGAPRNEDLGDGPLLDRFVRLRDETAFEALVLRHGPMVQGVCRRVLFDAHDAADAFQATFLVLVRKAASLRNGHQVGNWLYGVAYRTAVRARAHAGKRRAAGLDPAQEPAAEAFDEVERRDLTRVLDEELSRLPEIYRTPLVLCYLEGKSHEEAAAQVGCPRGTLETRLARARERLRQRLIRRGLALTVPLLASVLGPTADAAVPATLLRATVEAALLLVSGRADGVASPVLLLVHEVAQAMTFAKVKMVAALLLALGVTGSGAGWFYHAATAGVPGAAQAMAQGVAPKADGPDQADPAPADKAGPGGAPNRRTKQILNVLRSPVKFDGFEDPNMAFQEALDALADRYDLTFDLNERAFAEAQLDEVAAYKFAPRPLGKMTNVRLSRVLNKILDRLPTPAVYVVRGDVIEITTEQALRRELGVDEQMPLYPLIHGDQSQRTLAEWLRELADQAGYNVLLDPRASEMGQVKLTANLTNVPLDTAVRLLADMAGARMVHVGNVLYVTTTENAKEIEAEVLKAEAEGRVVHPPAFPGGRKGVPSGGM